jgi:hypothetical protein
VKPVAKNVAMPPEKSSTARVLDAPVDSTAAMLSSPAVAFTGSVTGMPMVTGRENFVPSGAKLTTGPAVCPLAGVTD